MLYQALRSTLNSKPSLIPYPTDVSKYTTSKLDYYTSLYQYTEDHKKIYETTGTLAGIKDTTTDKLFFDFDSKEDLNKAKSDVLALATTLIDKYKVSPDDIRTYYTGSKGFSLELDLVNRITPEEFKTTVYNLAGGLSTFDSVVNDSNRIVRVPNTRHQTTKHFKIPLALYELDEFSIPEIIKLSDKPRTAFTFHSNPVSLPTTLIAPTPKVVINTPTILSTIDYTSRPKGWKKYKWALLQGHFDSGERHQALMVIAATARGLGYDKDTTYYLCKSALKKQSALSGQEEFPKEELYKNIIEDSIFSDNWEGGQYSPKTNVWLASYCARMGFEVEERDDPSIIEIEDMSKLFTNYAENFEKNIIKTGHSLIDDNVMFLAGTHNGTLGAPGAGKTSWALDFLEHSSINGIDSVFFSLDMGLPMIFAKLIQREVGCSLKDAMRIFREEPIRANRMVETFKERYKHTSFNFKSGLTIPDMRNIIKDREDKTGHKVKLVITDYLERLAGPYSDATANTGLISNQLNDLAMEEQLCSVLLLQTQKHSTGEISDPLLSMRQIKGSSIIEQSCSVVLTLWREGYSPKTVDDDKYISFAAVKNRFGNLWSDDFSWDGVRGSVRELSEEERDELARFKQRKIDMKLKEQGIDKSWD